MILSRFVQWSIKKGRGRQSKRPEIRLFNELFTKVALFETARWLPTHGSTRCDGVALARYASAGRVASRQYFAELSAAPSSVSRAIPKKKRNANHNAKIIPGEEKVGQT
jgi:hypothetical protein